MTHSRVVKLVADYRKKVTKAALKKARDADRKNNAEHVRAVLKARRDAKESKMKKKKKEKKDKAAKNESRKQRGKLELKLLFH